MVCTINGRGSYLVIHHIPCKLGNPSFVLCRRGWGEDNIEPRVDNNEGLFIAMKYQHHDIVKTGEQDFGSFSI